jgi:hypothetical protein
VILKSDLLAVVLVLSPLVVMVEVLVVVLVVDYKVVVAAMVSSKDTPTLEAAVEAAADGMVVAVVAEETTLDLAPVMHLAVVVDQVIFTPLLFLASLESHLTIRMITKDLVVIQTLELLLSLQSKDHSLHKEVLQNIQLLCPIDLLMVGIQDLVEVRAHQHRVYVNLLFFGQVRSFMMETVLSLSMVQQQLEHTSTSQVHIDQIPFMVGHLMALLLEHSLLQMETSVTPSISAERVDTTLSMLYNEPVINLI